MDVDREDGNNATSTGIPASESGPKPEMIPAPDTPGLSEQLLPPHVPSERHPHSESSFDKAREPSQALTAHGAQYDEMPWGQLHNQCSRRGFRRKESKAVSKTRLTTMGTAELEGLDPGRWETRAGTCAGGGGHGYSCWYLGSAFFGWDTRAGAREGGEGLG